MIERLKKNPHLPGFLIGFGSVAFVGLIVIAAWGILSSGPTPTLAPTAVPVSQRVTVLPPATGQDGAPSPSPDDTPTATTVLPPTLTPTRAAPIRYTVKPGDTLFDIALAHGVSVETIQAANDLAGETIVPDQVLIIPSGPLPTPTPYVEGDFIVHTVSSGETLIGLAEHYSVTVEAIQAANDLQSETIQAGRQLRIPAKQTPPTPTPYSLLLTPLPVDRPWQPSILEGNLAAAYPLTQEGERFTLHYQPDTPAARDPGAIYTLVAEALEHIESRLDVTMEQPFDVYVAGTTFAPPDEQLRGRSFSAQRRNFYLFDDTGTPAERRYMVVHELTHLVIWNTVGQPSSVMLHEGLAVYIGIEAIDEGGFIPLQQFCAAYQQAGQLPRISGGRSYLGHIHDLDLYFAAGCFVEYLIETFKLDDFKQLFNSGDYTGIYGRTLSQLEAEWIKSLEPVGDELAFTPAELVDTVADVAAAYDHLFTNFSGAPAQMAAYRALDQARIAALQGQFDAARERLEASEKLLNGN